MLYQYLEVMFSYWTCEIVLLLLIVKPSWHSAENPTSSWSFTHQKLTEQLVSASPVLGTGVQWGRRQALALLKLSSSGEDRP